MKEEIIERIKLLIAERGHSVRAFAREIGVSEQNLYKCINGRIPNVEMLQKILSVYADVSAEWLLMGVGEPRKQDTEMLKEQIRVKDEQIRLLIGKIK